MNIAIGSPMDKTRTRFKSFKLYVATVISILAALLTSTGCQTVKGAGKDIEKAGEHIQDSADRHK